MHHIEQAKQWGIRDYQLKMEQRKQRAHKRELQRRLELAKNGQTFDGEEGEAEIKDDPREVVYTEDEDPTDALFIDPTTLKNGGVSPHILYVHALCYRKVKKYRVALASYLKVMKTRAQISDYEKMISKENKKNLDLKQVERKGFPGWKVDLYSHFKRLGIDSESHLPTEIDLRPYYTWKEGFSYDRLTQIIQTLQRARFFNRFDRDTLLQMMKMCDLRVVNKQSILFLDASENAVVIRGQLFLFSHTNDVETPQLQAILSQGDVIGNKAIDNGWSTDTHSWIVSYEETDVLVLKQDYMDYLWDKMKKSAVASEMADRMQRSECFKGLSEQTIYTIAFDMLNFKKFKKGERILSQDNLSIFNILFQKKQKDAIEKFTSNMKHDSDFQRALRAFKKESNPGVEDLFQQRKLEKQFHESLIKELLRRETLYGQKQKKAEEEERLATNDKDDKDDETKHSERDLYELSMLQFKFKLSPEEEEHERNIRKERTPAYKEMVKMTQKMQDFNNKHVSYLTKKYIQQLEDYKLNREQLPDEAKGIAILFEGEAIVKNAFDPATGRLDYNTTTVQGYGLQFVPSPTNMEILAAEKYLMVQGHAYYGNLYCPKTCEQGCTIGFLREDKLNLIPFYDLYLLKSKLEDRYASQLAKMKDKAEKSFKKVIREIDADIDKLLSQKQ